MGKRIVYCTPTLSICGGREKVVSSKANYLANNGWHVYIIHNKQGNREVFFELSPRVQVINLNHNDEIYTKCYFSRLIKRYINLRKYRRELEKLLYQIKPDITISTFGLEMAFLYKLKDGSKKILEIHGGRFFRQAAAKERQLGWKGTILSSFRTMKDYYFAKQYDAFVCLTNKDALSWGRMDNLHIIHNPITISDVGEANTNFKRVIAVGRLNTQKRFDILVRCWSKIPYEVRNGWQLNIFGNGEQKSFLEKMIADLNVEDSVHIKAPIMNIADEYKMSGIFCSTASFEGFSLALCEAMSAGLPVVTFDHPCGASDMILNDKMGMLIPMGREDIFIEKLQMLMTNPELRKNMGAEARRSVYERFTMDAVMQKWMNLFDSILKN